MMWLTIMQVAFVFSALLLAYIARLTRMSKAGKKGTGGPEI